MRLLLLVLCLAACGSSTGSSSDLATLDDMMVFLPTPDMAGACTTCSAFVTNCGPGLNCAKVLGHTGSLCCKTPGAVAAGQPCSKDEDCVADAVCLPDKLGIVQNRCYALCDGSHACATNTCNVFAGLQVCR
jgi:hypothetical protein